MGYPRLTPSDSAPPARVSRPAADPISLTARRFARHRPQQPQPTHHLSGADQLALSRIAERFAPGAQQARVPDLPEGPKVPEEPKVLEASRDQHPEPEAPQSPAAVATLLGMRAPIAVLIVVALLPSLAFGAMLWLGAIKTPWSSGGNENNALPAASLAATGPAPDHVRSKQTAAIGALALTAPDTLEAKAGQDVPFAIALDHTGDLPARSTIALAGLPEGATLSSGRPYGETEWNLRPDEIGDLRLVLPKAASGETTLRVKLVAPDGEIIAGTETILKVTGDADAAPVMRPKDSDTLFEPGNTVAPEVIYDEDLIGIGAWDEQSRRRLATTGVEERLTASDTPTAPPGEILRRPAASPAQATNDPLRAKWIKPSAYVNLRDGPTASASVISIVPKGTKLSVIGRKRGWVKVTNPATSESGWIYAGNIVGSSKPRGGAKRGSQSATAEGSGSSWLGSLLGSP
jgi:hypothetical protein